MTPSPLPPPGPELPVRKAFTVAPISYGQVWATHNGVDYRADHDGVRITVLDTDDQPVTSVLQTPEAAIALGQLLVQAAGAAIRNNITDTGAPAPLAERLARLQKGFTQ